MEKHVTVVGVLRFGFAALGLLAMFFVILGGIIVAVDSPDTVALIAMSAVALLLAALSAAGIIGGIGLLRYKPWARYFVMALAFLDLFNIPVGTAVGAYTIWILMQDETAELFAPEPDR